MPRTVAAAALAGLLLTGCSSSQPAPPRATAPTASASASPSVGPSVGPSVAPTKVLVVVLENHSLRRAWDQMPSLRATALRYGYASSYRAVTHPSLPNYLALAGGSTFGVTDDRGPSRHPLSGASVFGQALAQRRTAKAYVESMPEPCATAAAGRYAVKHNPWAYFADERQSCRRLDVPAGTAASGALRDDVLSGSLPAVGMVVPDLCSDGHDCSLAVSDRWLQAWLQVWEAGPDFTAERLAVVVTFDEDDRSQDNTVLTVVVHRSLHGREVTAPVSHLDLAAWLSAVAGAAPLRDSAGHTSLAAAFGLAGPD